MEKNDKYKDIFCISHQLFLSQGYEATTIRQISEQAGVSLGLTNHFFHSKETLAGLVLDMIAAYTALFCSVTHPCPQPLHRHVLAARVRILYLLKASSYRRFYLDTLEHDVLFPKLKKTPSRILCQLADLYHFPADDDLFLLYGTYVPYHYEKTLILGKESGLFSSILPEEIPDYITIGVFEHFLEHAILSEALLEARQAADTVLSRMPSKVPDDFLLNYLREQ
ncbi:MAG: TetR/AcrR family transcriptional regulator [Hungatella sp.]|nr:TetR/AcrR family transcriptional regulator [Hungatella sp.]